MLLLLVYICININIKKYYVITDIIIIMCIDIIIMCIDIIINIIILLLILLLILYYVYRYYYYVYSYYYVFVIRLLFAKETVISIIMYKSCVRSDQSYV